MALPETVLMPEEVKAELDCQATISFAGKPTIFPLIEDSKGKFGLWDIGGQKIIPVKFFRYTEDSRDDPYEHFERRGLQINAHDLDLNFPDSAIDASFAAQRFWVIEGQRTDDPWKNISGQTKRMLNIENLEIKIEVGAIDSKTGKILPKARP